MNGSPELGSGMLMTEIFEENLAKLDDLPRSIEVGRFFSFGCSTCSSRRGQLCSAKSKATGLAFSLPLDSWGAAFSTGQLPTRSRIGSCPICKSVLYSG